VGCLVLIPMLLITASNFVFSGGNNDESWLEAGPTLLARKNEVDKLAGNVYTPYMDIKRSNNIMCVYDIIAAIVVSSP